MRISLLGFYVWRWRWEIWLFVTNRFLPVYKFWFYSRSSWKIMLVIRCSHIVKSPLTCYLNHMRFTFDCMNRSLQRRIRMIRSIRMIWFIGNSASLHVSFSNWIFEFEILNIVHDFLIHLRYCWFILGHSAISHVVWITKSWVCSWIIITGIVVTTLTGLIV